MANKNRGKMEGLPPDMLIHKQECGEILFHGNISKVKRPSRYEQDPYNEEQNFLYNRALSGLAVYSKEEIDAMHWEKKKRIRKVHIKAQIVINIWKQQLVNILSNHFFTSIFPDSPLTKELIEDFGNVTDETYINKMPFKLLKITKPMIIERFIQEGILPKNFNELTPKQNASRISNKRHGNNSSNEPRNNSGTRIAEVIS